MRAAGGRHRRCSFCSSWRSRSARRSLAPYDPVATDSRRDPQAAGRRPSSRHRRSRPRHALAHHLGRPGLACSPGVISVVIAMLVGIPLGLCRRLRRRWLDMLIMRAADAVLAMPVPRSSPSRSPPSSGPSLDEHHDRHRRAADSDLRAAGARHRSSRCRRRSTSARRARSGCSPARIASRHVLPNMMPPLLIQSRLTAAAA